MNLAFAYLKSAVGKSGFGENVGIKPIGILWIAECEERKEKDERNDFFNHNWKIKLAIATIVKIATIANSI